MGLWVLIPITAPEPAVEIGRTAAGAAAIRGDETTDTTGLAICAVRRNADTTLTALTNGDRIARPWRDSDRTLHIFAAPSTPAGK